jgi:hypothetical protein
MAGDDLARLLGSGDRPRGTGATTPGTTAGSRPVPIVEAHSFDPLSTDSDKLENESQAPRAIDSNPSTAWRTEGYSRADLGGLKRGVGLILDLGSAKRASQLDLTLTTAGADFTLYAADDIVPPTIEDNRWQKVRSEQGAAQEVTVKLPGDAHQFYLIWFTNLPADGDNKFRAGVTEASFTS